MEHKTVPAEGKADRFLRLLNEAAEQLLAARDPTRTVRNLFDLIAGELQLDVYFNYLVDGDDLRLASSYGLDEVAERDGARLAFGAAVCGEVALQRRPQYVSNVQTCDASNVAFIRAVGLQAYACTPMLAGDRLLGTLGFGRRWCGEFQPEELQFLRTVTQYVAMAVERLRTQAALRESERRLNAVLDNASVSIFLMDDHQRCIYMNAAAERLTGYRLEETLDRPLHDVIHHTRPDGSHFPLEECPIDRAFPERAHQQGEEVFVHRDGHFYPVAFTASPIRDEASKTVGTIIEVRDITQERRNEQARDLLMREVDHRARNALSVVQSIVQLTQAPDLETYREVVLGRVSAVGRAQGALAAQRWEGADIRTMIAEELDAAMPDAARRLEGPNLTLAPEKAQPLGMVLHELGTNAVKHGALSKPGGQVSVTWNATPGGLELIWDEASTAISVTPPTRTGFGTRLIEMLARQLNGSVAYDWRASGLRLVLTIRS